MSFAFGIGIGTQNNQGEWLEVYYQQPIMTPDRDLIDVVESALDYKGDYYGALALSRFLGRPLRISLVSRVLVARVVQGKLMRRPPQTQMASQQGPPPRIPITCIWKPGAVITV